MAEVTTPPPKQSFVRRILGLCFIDALSGMAMGLFSSLIIGVILNQFLTMLGLQNLAFAQAIIRHTGAASPVIGAAIGVAIAFVLKAPPLVIYSTAAAAAIGYAASAGGVSAGPLGAYLSALACIGAGSFLSGKTRLDILLLPAAGILAGAVVGTLAGPPLAALMRGLGNLINQMTQLRPIPMGIAVSAIMGLILTAPISSAALAIMLGLNGLAGGAATAGCCAHMIGFAVASFRENGTAGLLAQGLGTSMLQVPNILKNPRILLPAIGASLVTGPLATAVFKLENSPLGSGMGTSGLVGPLTTWITMSNSEYSGALLVISIVLLHFLWPALIALGISELLRRFRWIKPGDMSLNLGQTP